MDLLPKVHAMMKYVYILTCPCKYYTGFTGKPNQIGET